MSQPSTPSFSPSNCLRILVTGGAGFIGSHLCERLVKEGHEVICLDNFFTGSRSNVMHLLPYPNFELIRHDVTEPILLEVDQIYHLACPASPVHYQYNPVKTIKTSVLGTINMLGLAKRTKARLLMASTSEVYGDPQVHPQQEDYWGHVNPIGLRSCYDEGKRVAETLCMDYHRQNDVDVKIVRIFNTYGPRMAPNDGRVVSNFIVQALQNESITLYGTGSQSRSFCFVSDLVEGFVRMMNASKANVTGPINLGNPHEFTIAELAEKVLALTGSNSQLVYKPLPSDDPVRRQPDITRAKAELQDWEPSIQLEEGLLSTIAYFRKQLLEGKGKIEVPMQKTAQEKALV
jgi:UDP-glucuronate decarboxylase